MVVAILLISIGAISTEKKDDDTSNLRTQNPVKATDIGGEEARVLITDGRPYFLLFGDSITEYSWRPDLMGFSALLANTYNRYVDIKNRGASGYTTRDSLEVLDTVFPLGPDSLVVQMPPSLVTIFLGANDIVMPGTWVKPDGTDHHVPVDEYKENMKKIINHIRQIRTDIPILLLTPPPVVDSGSRTNDKAKEYGRTVIALGEEMNIPVIDLFTLCQGDTIEIYPSFLVDGLHLNDKGNQLVHQAILDTIGGHYPDLHPGGAKAPRQEADPW